jgi:hypothetical protein
MKPETLARLMAAKERLDEQQRLFSQEVRAASNGQLHSQACPIGGLYAAGNCCFRGITCWCGAQGAPNVARDWPEYADSKENRQ